MFNFSKKRTNKTKQHDIGATHGVRNALVKMYGMLITLLICLCIIAGFYLIGSIVYNIFINPEKINPDDLISQQQKINIQTYEEVYKQLQEKQTQNPDNTVPRLFK